VLTCYALPENLPITLYLLVDFFSTGLSKSASNVANTFGLKAWPCADSQDFSPLPHP
jgi:hypothetical protein